jgi:hypothetical protein
MAREIAEIDPRYQEIEFKVPSVVFMTAEYGF